MAAFEFDFVAEEFGFLITPTDDKGNELPPPDDATRERTRQRELAQFLTTGKLTPLASYKPEKKDKKLAKQEKEFAQRCQIIAETAVEVMLVRGQLSQPDADPAPRVLDQSL